MVPENQPNPSSLASGARKALDLIPYGLFIMTSAFEDRAAGVLVKLVQLCAPEPPLICVTMLRGQSLEPLIRDSRAFALCQISEDERFLQKKFSPTVSTPDPASMRCAAGPDEYEDPFVSLAIHSAPSGSPIIERAMAWLDCELVRNVDLEPDHRMYVGRVTAGGVLDATCRPAILFGCNGAK